MWEVIKLLPQLECCRKFYLLILFNNKVSIKGVKSADRKTVEKDLRMNMRSQKQVKSV